MTERWKDIFILIILGVFAVMAMSWLTDVLLIDGLKVDKGFLGSILGGVLGMVGVSITTYFIIEAQKKFTEAQIEAQKIFTNEQIEIQKLVTFEQIEAQKEVTLRQVADADAKSRLLLLNQVKLNNYERTLSSLNSLEFEIKVFYSNIKRLVSLNESINSENLGAEEVQWIKDAENGKNESYYILNNRLLILTTNFRANYIADTADYEMLTKILYLFNEIANQADNLLRISDKSDITIGEIVRKINELHSNFASMSSFLRDFLFNKMDQIERELSKNLNI